jgi:hypothetical protein
MPLRSLHVLPRSNTISTCSLSQSAARQLCLSLQQLLRHCERFRCISGPTLQSLRLTLPEGSSVWAGCGKLGCAPLDVFEVLQELPQCFCTGEEQLKCCLPPALHRLTWCLLRGNDPELSFVRELELSRLLRRVRRLRQLRMLEVVHPATPMVQQLQNFLQCLPAALEELCFTCVLNSELTIKAIITSVPSNMRLSSWAVHHDASAICHLRLAFVLRRCDKIALMDAKL